MSYSSVYTCVPGPIVARSNGSIVLCWMFSSMPMTTSPPRWSIPRIGGFSFSKVPRPGTPLSRRRRPLRPLFDGLGLALVAGHDRHFAALDLSGQARLRRAGHDACAQLLGQRLHVVLIQPQFLSNLLVGQVQAHEIHA